ncbi:LytR family transcriptional regulator [bacterium D16-34]|nr:LytR family transcriptional regulator [bacterium D16-34]
MGEDTKQQTGSNQVEQAQEKRKHSSTHNAGLAVVWVVIFAAAFIGLVCGLDQLAGDDTEVVAPASSTDEVVQEPFYVLLIGSDSRKGTALYTGKASEHAQLDQHSDIMTLVRIDPETYTITLVTVPRDTQLAGRSDRINDALVDGNPEQVVEVVEALTGASIKGYMMTTFTGYEELIDALGGITVDIPRTITVPDPSTAEKVTVEEGKNKTLDGSEALVFARARKEYVDDQDAIRQNNVRSLEIAMIEKVLNQNDLEANKSVADLEEYTTTNLPMNEMTALVLDFVNHKDDVTIYSCTGPYAGGENKDGLWVIDQDEDTWKELMALVDSGEDPRGVVEEPQLKN